MIRRLPLFALSLLFACAGFAQAQPSGPSLLEQKMGIAKFREAGLDRQTPQQLKVLEEWLLGNAAEIASSQAASEASTASAAAISSARRSWFGLSKTEKKDGVPTSTVVSRVSGSFTGWRPGTTLELENGQKWKINDGSSLYVRKPLDRPQATIAPGLFGVWNLQVQGYNTSAKVIPAN